MLSGETYEDWERDYLTLRDDDDDCMRKMRLEIGRLPLAQKRLMILYIELGTYSSVAKVLKCSVPTISKKVRQIKDYLQKKTRNICRDY